MCCLYGMCLQGRGNIKALPSFRFDSYADSAPKLYSAPPGAAHVTGICRAYITTLALEPIGIHFSCIVVCPAAADQDSFL